MATRIDRNLNADVARRNRDARPGRSTGAEGAIG